MIVVAPITEIRCECDHSRESHQLNGICILCYLNARRWNQEPTEAQHAFEPRIRILGQQLRV